MTADDRTVRDAIWQAAIELLDQHAADGDGRCRRCRCATPCPGQVLARAGLDEAAGVPSAETAYWYGFVRARMVAADHVPTEDRAADLVGVR